MAITTRIVVATALFLAGLADCEINMTEYHKMPQLYTLDDYDRCFAEFPKSGVYCVARADIQPNEASQLWMQIKNFSDDYKRHFKHNELFYGICVNWCRHELETLNISGSDYYAGLLQNNAMVNFYLKVFASEEDNRQLYNRNVNQCINYHLKQKYGLEALSNIEYCDRSPQAPKDTSTHFDIWNGMFYLALGGAIAIGLVATAYDYATNRDAALAAPKTAATDFTFENILLAFSLRRNYLRITSQREHEIGKDLQFMDCFKFVLIFGVILVHTGWIVIQSPLLNPDHFEKLLEQIGSITQTNGNIMVTAFFVISGFLLTVIFKTELKANLEVNYFILFAKIIILRFLRLSTMYVFTILMHAANFQQNGGPVWRHIFEREQWACRRYWWANVFYINNYVKLDEHCVVQGWYLATDTQIFIVSLLLLFFFHKRPKCTIPVLGALAFLAIAIPTIVVYVYQLEGIFLTGLNDLKNIFFDMPAFQRYYIPFETNFGAGVFGIMAGSLYVYIKEKKYELRKYTPFVAIWWAIFPLGILLFFSGYLFVYYDFEKPSVWVALYGGLNRNLWALGTAFIVLGMAFGVGGIFRKFSCSPVFLVLGRLSFGAYLAHLFVIRLTLASMRQPIYVHDFLLFVLVFGVTVFSYLIGMIMTFLIELPTSAVVKIFIIKFKLEMQ